MNRVVTLDLRIFWDIFQLIFGYKQAFTVKTLRYWIIAQINRKYIIHVGHSIVNGFAPGSHNGESLFVAVNLL